MLVYVDDYKGYIRAFKGVERLHLGLGERTCQVELAQPPIPSLVHRQINGDIVNMEILQIPNAMLEQLKGDFGLAGKDISALTLVDKVRFLSYEFRRSCGMSDLLTPATDSDSVEIPLHKYGQARRYSSTRDLKPYDATDSTSATIIPSKS